MKMSQYQRPHTTLSRRTLLQGGGAAIAGLSVLRLAGPAHAFPGAQDAVIIPWLDQPDPNPVPEVIVQQLVWEALDSWITPNDEFFVIKHFDQPELNEADWRLEVGGLVDRPMALTLDDLKTRERQEVAFTLECSGNSGLPFFTGGVGNEVWGAPIAGVEVRIDDGPWSPATLTEPGTEFAWAFWELAWGTPVPGEHAITLRAIAADDEVQPAPDDPLLASKATYWESNGQITRRIGIA